MDGMKGMDAGLVFAMIFAIIFIALLLVFGFGQVTSMFCFSGQAQIDKSVKDLENAVQNTYNLAEGSAKPFAVSIPSGSSVCVINPADVSANPAGGWMPLDDQLPVIRAKVEVRQSNVWINYNCGNGEQTYKIEHLRARDRPGYAGTGSFCAEAGGSIYLENKGDYVAASRG
jgi:hypothetical protein